MLARECSKSFNLDFSSTWTEKFQMYKLDLEKAEEPEPQLLTSVGSLKKQKSSRKTSTSALMTTLKSLIDCVDHNKLWKILKEMEIPDHLTFLLRNLCAGQESTVRTRYGTTDWLQTGRWIHRGWYCHPVYLTDMQSTSCEMLGWMKHKLESRLLGEVSITSDM